jgi:type IV pilus assembly protein PilQ
MLSVFLPSQVRAQHPDSLIVKDTLGFQLEILAGKLPGLNDRVDLTVSEMPIQEFFRNLAETNALNIHVDPNLRYKLTNNFSSVRAIDLLLFMKEEYNLDVHVIGEIISVKRPPRVLTPPKPYIRKDIDVSYDNNTETLSMNLKQDSLLFVVEKITRVSGHNILLDASLHDKKVSAFILQLPWKEAVRRLAELHKLEFVEDKDVCLINPIEKEEASVASARNNSNSRFKLKNNRNNRANAPTNMLVEILDSGFIFVEASNVPLDELITEVSEKAGQSYLIYDEMSESVDISVKSGTYDDIVQQLILGTKYTVSLDRGVYLYGKLEQNELKRTEIVKIEYRSVEGILEVFGENKKNSVQMKELPLLNSIYIYGTDSEVKSARELIKKLDQIVPVVLIEVLIIDSQEGTKISTGISAGVGEPVETSGTILPGFDFSLSASTINKMIQNLNGNGWFNLGKVTPDFYMTLQAMEDEGIVNIRSTPRLSTLNGMEAELTIGKTDYYIEEQNNFSYSISTQNYNTKTYKPVKADFTVKITPFVSGDEQITLKVDVSQSDFTGRISKEAPPGQVTRSFKSTIRVRNEEMVLLGGLEENSIEKTSKGFPLLNRIPILNWLLSTRTREKSQEKLNFFIKPTIIY